MSSIPVITISLPSCSACVSPRIVCLHLLVTLTVLFSLFPFFFPACRQTHHHSVRLLASGRLFSGEADTELHSRQNDQNYPLERQPKKKLFPSSTFLQSFTLSKSALTRQCFTSAATCGSREEMDGREQRSHCCLIDRCSLTSCHLLLLRACLLLAARTGCNVFAEPSARSSHMWPVRAVLRGTLAPARLPCTRWQSSCSCT